MVTYLVKILTAINVLTCTSVYKKKRNRVTVKIQKFTEMGYN